MQQKLLFSKNIDSDTSPEAMAEGSGRYRLNTRIANSENGQNESAEDVLGNTLVSFTLPTGNNTQIGSFEYKKNKKIYYFVYNSSFNHTILEYNSLTNSVSVVFQDSVNILGGANNILNFQLDHLITGIDVVELDSNNHLLYWTDGYVSQVDPNVYNEPKKINIEKGKFFMTGDHVNGYKTPFDPEILYRIKKSSDNGPTYVWAKGVHEIQVTSNILQNDITDPDLANPPGGPVVVRYNVVQFDDSNEFDITTFTWTVGETYLYNLSATINATTSVLGVGGGTFSIYVNGVTVNTIPITPLFTSLLVGTNYVNQFTLNLNAGDLVKIVVENLTSPTTLIIKGISFSSQKVKVNYLFKQFPVFKTQFVYDDNDVSSWSPWSPYVFPSVVHDTATGNDIISQDDTINVIVDTGINIVVKINIAVKMLGQILVNNVLQDLEFSLIASLDKRILNIADNTTYAFIFLNDGNYTPIYINESIKLFDWIPLASQSQAQIIDGRLTDGLVTENQDSIDIDFRMNLSFIDIGTFPNWQTLLSPATFLKSGGTYKYGIVYADHGGRLGTTNLQRAASTILLPNGKYGTTLYVPFLTEVGYAAPHAAPNTDMSFVPQVNMEIYNSPPTWATHYTIVRSKNEVIANYFQFDAQGVSYVDTSGAPVTPSSAAYIYIDISNILGRYLSENGASTLVYDFTPGDRIRFIAYPVGSGHAFTEISSFFSFNDSQILAYNSGTGIITVAVNSSIPLTMADGVFFEIYTPAQTVIDDNEFVYEIGESFPLVKDIHNNLVHSFSSSNQLIVASSSSAYSAPNIVAQVLAGHGLLVNYKVKIEGVGWSIYGVISVSNATNVTIDTTGFLFTGGYLTTTSTIYKAATGVLKSGDCFRVYQNMPWIYTGIVNRLYTFVENMNASNLWVSNAWDYARPNVVDDSVKRVTRPSMVRWSEVFIPETLVNGLSTVYDTNFQEYEQKYGGIYKLFNNNLYLDCFQELKVSKILIQQSVLNTTQGQNFVGQSTEVLPRIPEYYLGEYGIGKNPESFANYGIRKYFIDTNRGAVLRLSNDGLISISDEANMNNYFMNKCRDVLNYNTRVNIYGVYDAKFGEYIISFQDIQGAGGSNFVRETLAFNENENFWSTFYSYLPDGMCSNGVNMVSFKNGSIWTHNTNAIYNNFYGVQYKSSLWVYYNVAPSNIKILEAIALETSDGNWNVTFETPVTQQNPSGQTTLLIPNNFQFKEGYFYSEILRDDNTPNNVVGPPLLPNARFEGNPMKGQYALVKLEFQGTNYVRIFAANVNFIPSPRSNS